MTYLTIDPTDSRPPYEQLSSQLLQMISRGELVEGDRVASIRQLARDLGLAPNTVARAYRELEHLGVLASAGRRGTIVTATNTSPSVRQNQVVAELGQAVDAAVAADLAPADIIRAVELRLRRPRPSIP